MDNNFLGKRAELGVYDDAACFTPEERETYHNMLVSHSLDSGINVLDDKFWMEGDDCHEYVVPSPKALHDQITVEQHRKVLDQINSFNTDAFDALMDHIEASQKIKKMDLRKSWITTSNVYDALFTEFTIKDKNIMVAPHYILPAGEHTVVLSDSLHTPNRAERRKKQKEERKRKYK